MKQLTEDECQKLSNALTHVVFRNGAVEDLHAENAVLDDNTMKILNKDINNRIYTLLKWLCCSDEETRQAAVSLIFNDLNIEPYWDDAIENDELTKAMALYRRMIGRST